MTTSVIGALRANLGLNAARFEAGLKQSDRAVQNFGRSVLKVAAGIGAAFGAALSLRSLKGAADDWSDLTGRVGAAVKDMEAAPALMQDMLQLANATRSGIHQTVETFSSNVSAMRDLGYATQQTLEYTESLGLMLDLTSTKGQNATSVQNALNKAMAVGRLDTMGLQTVLTHGGRVAEALAEELGTTVSGLRDLASQGKITGDVIARSLIGSLEDVRAEVGDQAGTITDALTKIRNGMLALVGVFDEASGASAAVARALEGVAAAIASAVKWISDNGRVVMTVLNTMAGTAAVVATVFATKYAVAVGVTAVKAMVSAWRSSVALNVALGAQSMAAARVGAAVKTLTLAFRGLRAALISTGIGALAVAAGYLVGKFMELVSAAGGFGNAMTLVGEVAREAWKRVGLHFDMLKARIEGGWKDMQADAHDMFAAIISGGVTFANRYIGIFNGAFEAIKEIWGRLPAAIGDLAFQAAQALLRGVEWMLTQAAKPIDLFLTGINKARTALGAEAIELIGEVKLPDMENPYADQAKEAGRAAAEAFKKGFQTDTFNQPAGVLGSLTGTADELRGQADAYREAAGMLSKAASGPMPAWERLKELLRGTKDEVEDIPPVAADAGDALTDIGDKGGAGGKAASAGMKKVKEAVDEVAKAAERGANAIGDLFADLMTGARSLKDGIIDLIREIARMQIMKGFKMLFGADGPFSSVGATLGGLLGSNANGTPNWRGGMTRIHERGGEIVDLPAGTRIIPHDLSKRMLDQQGDMKLEVHIHENTADGQHQVRQSPGRIDVMLRKELSDMVRSGGLDGAIGQRFGMRAKAAGG